MSPAALGIAIVLVCAVVEAFAQICLKLSSRPAAPRLRWIGIGLVLFVVEAVLYTLALQRLDVGVAYALGATSFVAVALGSSVLLGERLPRVRWLGIGCILAGCAVLAAQGAAA